MKPNMSIFLYLIWTFLRRRVMCVRFLRALLPPLYMMRGPGAGSAPSPSSAPHAARCL